jgi:demethylmenaquinone methyltransferase/2-methoxy-6-polyprenyl-1,4-benzoquinol methylase
MDLIQQMNSDLGAYYARRAPEYDRIYLPPVRQTALNEAVSTVAAYFAGRRVLEIACGTGYWTERIASTAHSVLATDLAEPMLEMARQRDYPNGNVAFARQNLLDLQVTGAFDAAFGGFIWSHLKPDELKRMLDGLHKTLEPGSRVLFTDNRYVAGSSTPIAHTDAQGNTYQKRTLDDGSEFLILKNFPQPDDFRRVLEQRVRDWTIHTSEYYWLLTYQI